MLLEFSVLASGSSGNALYIRSHTTNIMLDAGISGKQLQERLQHSSGKSLSDMDALLLTHEHIDHVRGLRQVIKQSAASIYVTEGTWNQVAASVEKDFALREAANPAGHPLTGSRLQGSQAPLEPQQVHFVKSGQGFLVGDIAVTPFTVSHDAEEPVAYRFDCGSSSLTVATDLGYVSDAIKEVIAGCQCYVFESNHDVDMLRAGRYPWNIKRRILGDKGHLSNYDAALALADLLGTQEVEVYLAHLSEENNQVDLAELTVASVLRELRESYAEQVHLRRTSRHEATSLHNLA